MAMDATSSHARIRDRSGESTRAELVAEVSRWPSASGSQLPVSLVRSAEARAKSARALADRPRIPE